ncbi:MAG: head-tail adaptor protein [Pseudomonadota bacterium]
MQSLPILRRRLTLEERERVEDGGGGTTESWVAKGNLWAEVQRASLRARDDGGRLADITRYRITVRAAPFGHPSRPRPGQRLSERGRAFTILGVSEADGAGHYLRLDAEEGAL